MAFLSFLDDIVHAIKLQKLQRSPLKTQDRQTEIPPPILK